jgi:HEAT repeat protein
LSSKLSSLVQATNDTKVLLYVYVALGDDFLPHGHCFYDVVARIRQQALQRLIGKWCQFQLARLQRRQQEILEDQIAEVLLEKRERQLAGNLFQQSSLKLFISKLEDAQVSVIRQTLESNDPMVRLLAARTAGMRRLHLEKELIELLNDPYPLVREAARLALVRCTRGTDFGPIPGASQRTLVRSIEKWRQWLALQKSASPQRSAKNTPIAGGKTAQLAPLDIVPLVLVHEDKPELSSELARACDELVNASEKEQFSLLARLCKSKDSQSDYVLALAIPKLSSEIQQQARDALTKRLTRLSAAALRDKLQDDNPEVRSAAAFACGRKIDKEHIADLLQLLDDPEIVVVQSARVALTELSGEDFGPTSDADRTGRADAVAAWRKWWKGRQDKPK